MALYINYLKVHNFAEDVVVCMHAHTKKQKQNNEIIKKKPAKKQE